MRTVRAASRRRRGPRGQGEDQHARSGGNTGSDLPLSLSTARQAGLRVLPGLCAGVLLAAEQVRRLLRRPWLHAAEGGRVVCLRPGHSTPWIGLPGRRCCATPPRRHTPGKGTAPEGAAYRPQMIRAGVSQDKPQNALRTVLPAPNTCSRSRGCPGPSVVVSRQSERRSCCRPIRRFMLVRRPRTGRGRSASVRH